MSYCESLTAKMWRSVTPGSWLGKHRGMTLLHLASALGYAKLVRTMLTWKAENSNVILEAEIDALSQDQDGFTPLVSTGFGGIVSVRFQILARILHRCGPVPEVTLRPPSSSTSGTRPH